MVLLGDDEAQDAPVKATNIQVPLYYILLAMNVVSYWLILGFVIRRYI